MNTKLAVVLTAILGFAATTVVLAQDAEQAPAVNSEMAAPTMDSTEMAAPAMDSTEMAEPMVNTEAPAAPSNTY